MGNGNFLIKMVRPIKTRAKPELGQSGVLLAAEKHTAKSGMARLALTTARTSVSAPSLYESLNWIKK